MVITNWILISARATTVWIMITATAGRLSSAVLSADGSAKNRIAKAVIRGIFRRG